MLSHVSLSRSISLRRLPLTRMLTFARCPKSFPGWLHWAAAFIFSCCAIAASRPGIADTQNAPIGTRTLQFPNDSSLGALYVVPIPKPWELENKRFAAKAKGDVRLTVPPGYMVAWDVNRHVLEKPECWNHVPEHGIECLRLRFFSLQEGEASLTDKIIQYVPRLKDLVYLDLRQSDVTDEGIGTLAVMKNLKEITLKNSAITGSCFKSLEHFPELKDINASDISLDQTALTYLSKVPKLKRLALSSTKLDKSDITKICKCKGLTNLSVANNRKVDDSCMGSFLALTELQNLDLGGTSVTLRGVAMLKPLTKLQILVLPASIQTENDRQEMKKIFPHRQIYYSKSSTPTDEQKYLFAPLK